MADTQTAPTVNAELVKELKQALALAESGQLANGVFVGIGAKIFHRSYSIPKPEDMLTVIGELGTFKTELEMMVIGGRAAQMQNRQRFFRG